MLDKKSGKYIASALVAATLTVTAPGAMAFCFSNDSLSNTEMLVTQVDQSKFAKVVSDTWKRSGGRFCEFSDADKALCKMGGAFVQFPEKATKAVIIDNVNRIYNLMTGRSVLGDKTNHVKKGWDATVKKGWNKSGGAALNYIGDRMSDAKALLHTRFRKRVGPDSTQCCNWRNKDCNPSGKKDGKIHFEIKYAGISRIVQLGATDHMECRINKNDPDSAGCVNYEFPKSPFRAHKKTSRGMLIKSKHTGMCLDVWLRNEKNGANVAISKCHGGKNQRWTVNRNGTIQSEMNGKCLDLVTGPVKPAKNGTNVHMWNCHGGLSQRWVYGSNGKIISRARGQHNWCLEVGGWKKHNGANANVWKCGGNQANQAWQATRG